MDLTNNDYPRNVDKILEQYRPLINRMYAKYKGFFTHTLGKNSYMRGKPGGSRNEYPSHADQADLYSYIEEQVVRLVIEYDPHSAIDFPGYIAIKLDRRIAGSYIHHQRRHDYREQVGYADDTVEKKLDDKVDYDSSLYQEIVTNTFNNLDDPVDRAIFKVLTSVDSLSDYRVFRAVKNQFNNLSRTDFDTRLERLKALVLSEIRDNPKIL